MLVGPKVADVLAVFDSYWTLGLSLPVVAMWPAFKANKQASRKRRARHVQLAQSRQFMPQTLDGRSPDRFLTGRRRWTDQLYLLADPPDKAYGKHSEPWINTAIATMLDAAKKPRCG
jgi:cardiolipin synthase C